MDKPTKSKLKMKKCSRPTSFFQDGSYVCEGPNNKQGEEYDRQDSEGDFHSCIGDDEVTKNEGNSSFEERFYCDDSLVDKAFLDFADQEHVENRFNMQRRDNSRHGNEANPYILKESYMCRDTTASHGTVGESCFVDSRPDHGDRLHCFKVRKERKAKHGDPTDSVKVDSEREIDTSHPKSYPCDLELSPVYNHRYRGSSGSIDANASLGSMTIDHHGETKLSHGSGVDGCATTASVCDSPGVYFSCYSSMSDLRQDLTLPPFCIPVNDVSTQALSSDNDAWAHFFNSVVSENIKIELEDIKKYNRYSSDLNQSSPGFGKNYHQARKPISHKPTQAGDGHSKILESNLRISDKSKVLNKCQKTQRDLPPLTVPKSLYPSRRTQSSSPRPSRIPRPVLRESSPSIKRCPSGTAIDTYHAVHPVCKKHHSANASRDVALSLNQPEVTRGRRRLKKETILSDASTLQRNLRQHSKYTSGKGGTAWTVSSNAESASKTVSQSVTCRQKRWRQTVDKWDSQGTFKSDHPRRLSREFLRRGKIIITSPREVCYPSPPSTAPPGSPVSLPSVGSSPDVIENQQDDIFSKCFSSQAKSLTEAANVNAKADNNVNECCEMRTIRRNKKRVNKRSSYKSEASMMKTSVEDIQNSSQVSKNIGTTDPSVSEWRTDHKVNMIQQATKLKPPQNMMADIQYDHYGVSQLSFDLVAPDPNLDSSQFMNPESHHKCHQVHNFAVNRPNSLQYQNPSSRSSIPVEVHHRPIDCSPSYGTMSLNSSTLSNMLDSPSYYKPLTSNTGTSLIDTSLEGSLQLEIDINACVTNPTASPSFTHVPVTPYSSIDSNYASLSMMTEDASLSYLADRDSLSLPLSPEFSLCKDLESPAVNTGVSQVSTDTLAYTSLFDRLPLLKDNFKLDFSNIEEMNASCSPPIIVAASPQFRTVSLEPEVFQDMNGINKRQKQGDEGAVIDEGSLHSDDSLESSGSTSHVLASSLFYADNSVRPSQVFDRKVFLKSRQSILGAKVRASVAWLLSKVYGDKVPREMKDPFYETSQGQLALRPVLVNLMSSSELYCQACASIFPDTHAQWSGHWNIIQVLSRKGIYIKDTKESAVTETVLVQTAPFKLKAHLALIDALMRAYICEVASVEKVVKAVRNFTSFPASSELPGSSEEALKFWVNKVCGTISKEGVSACHKGKQLLQGNAGQKVLVTTTSTGASSSEPISVPLIEDLMRDIGDGGSVAALIAYYRPNLLNIKSVCLKDSIGIADSLYNLRLIGQFCKAHLPWRCFHLTYEDLLYTHTSLHVNICTFLADLFFCFEGPGCSFASGAANAVMVAKEKIDAMPAAGKRSTLSNTTASAAISGDAGPPTSPSAAASSTIGVTNVPISNATKRSFQKRPSLEDTAGNLGIGGRTAFPGNSGQHHPLLPRRSGGRRSFTQDDGSGGVGSLLKPGSPPTQARRGRRTVSLCSPQDREMVQRSVLAWQEEQKDNGAGDGRREQTNARRGTDGANSSNLLANVSIDSNMDQSFTTDASMSLNLGDLNSPRTGRNSALDPNHPEYMEVESVTSGHPSRYASPHSTARSQVNIGHDSGINQDGGGDVSYQPEPLMPAVLKPTKERDGSLISKAQERDDRSPRRRKVASPTESLQHRQSLQHQRQQQTGRSQNLSSQDDLNVSLSGSSSETTVSPLPGEDGQIHGLIYGMSHGYSPQPHLSQSIDLPPEAPHSARSSAHSVAESYTIQDRPNTVQGARAAGIPVVCESLSSSYPPMDHHSSREGSVASSGGDFSDHESHKIHQDHKIRESNIPTASEGKPVSTSEFCAIEKPTMVIADQLNSPDISNILNNNGENLNGNNNNIVTTKSPTNANTTSFAELKRLKDKLDFDNVDKVDNSGLIYMQTGSPGGQFKKMGGVDLKTTYLNSQGHGQGKTTTFSQLSQASDRQVVNNTNGRMSPGHMQRMSPVQAVEDAGENNSCFNSVMTTSDPGSSELQQLRLKLEQKRKEIEKKKHRQEAQQNRMRQRLGKAAFMRVVSKHMEEGDEGEEGGQDGTHSELMGQQPSSMQAQIQARLGLNPTGQRSQSPGAQGKKQVLIGGPGQNHVASPGSLPPEASAQRFTDWRSQTIGRQQGSPSQSPGRIGSVGLQSSAEQHQQQTQGAFSRAGIQQTIDNVRNKWFNGGVGGSDSLVIDNRDDDDTDSDGQVAVNGRSGNSFRLHDGAPLLGRTPSQSSRPSSTPPHSQGASHSPSPSLTSQQPRAGSVPREIPPSSSQAAISPRRSSEGADVSQQQQYQEYDSSLDRLNTSLTDLQGEIMRLSLQHEQQQRVQNIAESSDPRLSAALSAIGSPGTGTVARQQDSPQAQQSQQLRTSQTRPIHGIPHQQPLVHGGRPQQIPPSYTQQQPQTQQSHPLERTGVDFAGPGSNRQGGDTYHEHSSASQNNQLSEQIRNKYQGAQIDSNAKDNTAGGGFFVSFGDEASPKRSKPKLGEHRSTPQPRGVSPSPQMATPSALKPQAQPQQPLFAAMSDISPSTDLDPAVVANLAGQAVAPLTPASKGDRAVEEAGGSPSVGFVIQDQASLAVDPTMGDEMQKKKIKLMEMQRKRKEDQERKKAEKEAEIARKQEEKMYKEEEQERRKAEERARKDKIFQQYLQKKNAGDEDHHDGPPHSQARPKVKRRERSASNSTAPSGNRPRPKSMFVKAATPEPGSLGGPDSCGSSQEDLTRVGGHSGRTTPGVMSVRTPHYLRLPQQRIRKAVSCNTLQGPNPGGSSTFRRPPSPDLYKLRQQRQQRGNSQDSGSDNGSGSNPGSTTGAEFSGPKLYVKPSAKSNRHIIVNAISHCCLAGSVNTDMKNKVLEEMSKCDANHFLILFRDAGCQYRGLFILYPDTEEAVKVCGVGPKHITNKMCEKFYKYNSGGKSFSEIVSKKHLSVSVDAVVLLNSLWKSGKAAIKR